MGSCAITTRIISSVSIVELWWKQCDKASKDDEKDNDQDTGDDGGSQGTIAICMTDIDQVVDHVTAISDTPVFCSPRLRVIFRRHGSYCTISQQLTCSATWIF